MQNCLIDCRFDGAWVLQESKKNILPVDVLLDDLRRTVGGENSLRVLKKNYMGCRLVVTLPEGGAGALESDIRRILLRHWSGGEAEKALTLTSKPLTEEEAARLLDGEPRQEAAKAARAAASELPAKTAEETAAPARKGARRREDAPAPREDEALSAVRSLIGAEEFKALAEELAAVAPRIRQTGARRAFLSQHYLFAIGEGCGLTTALERLADLVESLGLYTFPGKKRTMETALDAPAGDEHEPLLKMQEYLNSRNRFKGLLCIDISHWISRARDPKFQRFLRAVSKASDDTLFVFRVPYIQPDVLEEVRRGLADVLRVRCATFVPFSNEEYGEFARRQIEQSGFSMEEDAWPPFYARLAEEKSSARFYGLNTVEKLTSEMLYRKLLQGEGTAISAADLDGLAPEMDGRSGLDELDEMIGMEPVRDRILEMVAQVRMQLEMADSGKGPERPCLHMRFVGSPGTGKTTVARIVGKILREKGILEIGNFHEVSGRSLCGRYVGETAPKTSEICRSAYGSVLFIDEAYSLYAGDDNTRDYGKEAIDTLIAEMENNRDKMVVILSGYPDEMDTLMRANPGLAGRIPYEIRFPNYSRDQLTDIFLQMAGKSFPFGDDFRQAAADFFGSIRDSSLKAKSFGNARLARNLYERVWAKAAVRRQLNKDGDVRLLPEDLRSAVADREFQQLLCEKGGAIGFAAPRSTETHL